MIVTAAAVVGLVWTVTYKITPHTVALGGQPSSSPSPDEGTHAASGSSPTPSPTPKGVTGTFTGQDVPNRYGDVQVRVVIADGRITDVQALQLPTDRAESAFISQQAGPMLHDEVIQAQSAHIDIIGGATYTSDSYAASVESALQQAHMG